LNFFNRIIFCLLLAAPAYASQNTSSPFEIPRSTVAELTDSNSGRIYPVFIKLPRSYNTPESIAKNRQYPVIYMMDGGYSFQVVSGATRFPMNSGAMEEAILVAVSYSKEISAIDSRIRDYTPVYAKNWKRLTGQAKAHTDFIQAAVFPFIEEQYRAEPSRRTFVGNSLGGLLGAYIVLARPDLFDSYVLGSPSVWFNNDYILSLAASPIKKTKRVYIAVGSLETPGNGLHNDMVSGAKALAEKLKVNTKVDLKLAIINGAHHDTAFPTSAVQGLDWLYRK
jgi:predicted alpha/beta superfamily hydrolase